MRLIAIVVVVAGFLFNAAPAAAEAHKQIRTEKGNDLVVEGHETVTAPTTKAPAKRSNTPTTVYVPVDCNAPNAKSYGKRYQNDCSVSTLALLQYFRTPTTRPPVTPKSYARDYFNTVALPTPKPTISAPNGGITGAVHSLNLNTANTMTYTDGATPFGQLDIKAKATYTVDWGDGTTDVYTDTGADWPNSKITHTWTKVGFYDIKVTAKWNANYSFGADSGTINGLTTTGTITHWPVSEVQAVIVK